MQRTTPSLATPLPWRLRAVGRWLCVPGFRRVCPQINDPPAVRQKKQLDTSLAAIGSACPHGSSDAGQRCQKPHALVRSCPMCRSASPAPASPRQRHPAPTHRSRARPMGHGGSRRGFCPSSGTRRTSQAAAHLVDHVPRRCRCASGCCPCQSHCACCCPRSLPKRCPNSSVLRWPQGCRRSAAAFTGFLDFLLFRSKL